MQNYHYSYLVGVLIFGAAWLACYLLGKSYRAEIRWGTLISAPMALTAGGAIWSVAYEYVQGYRLEPAAS